VVRLPVHLHELMAKVAKTDMDFQLAHGVRPSQEHLASLVGITVEKLAMLTKVWPVASRSPVTGFFWCSVCACAAWGLLSMCFLVLASPALYTSAVHSVWCISAVLCYLCCV
jgi:hypothetical protein